MSGRPLVDVTTVDTAVPSRPAISSTCSVSCVVAPTVRFCVTVAPFSLRKVTVIGAACAFGLAMSTSRSKNEPVEPSARK
jgi:hypothetical protein